MVVPTFLMGGTLPILSRYFVRNMAEVESKLGTLYALNTFGAAVGTLGAALLLIPGLGSQLTTTWIAALNVGLGLLAIRLDLGRNRFPILRAKLDKTKAPRSNRPPIRRHPARKTVWFWPLCSCPDSLR